MSISDKLLEINQVKEDIKNAIEDKGVSMDNVPFTDYPEKVLEISGGSGGGQGYTLTVNDAYDIYTLIYANGTISEESTNGTFYNVVAICYNHGINNVNGDVFKFLVGVYKPSLSRTFYFTALLLSDTTLNVLGSGGGSN